MSELGDLIAWRASLVEARMSGVREVADQNGERISYKSDSEMARAIAAADREIAALRSGRRRPLIVYPAVSKGL